MRYLIITRTRISAALAMAIKTVNSIDLVFFVVVIEIFADLFAGSLSLLLAGCRRIVRLPVSRFESSKVSLTATRDLNQASLQSGRLTFWDLAVPLSHVMFSAEFITQTRCAFLLGRLRSHGLTTNRADA